jgi:hypothetical protein
VFRLVPAGALVASARGETKNSSSGTMAWEGPGDCLKVRLITVSATAAETTSFATTAARAAPPAATPVFSWSGFVDCQ